MNASLAFVLGTACGRLWFKPLYIGRRSGARDRGGGADYLPVPRACPLVRATIGAQSELA